MEQTLCLEFSAKISAPEVVGVRFGRFGVHAFSLQNPSGLAR